MTFFLLFVGSVFEFKSFVYRLDLFQGRKIGCDCATKHGSGACLFHRRFTTAVNPAASTTQDSTAPEVDVPTRIKFKRLDKTARHIMQVYLLLLYISFPRNVCNLCSFLCSIQCVLNRFWIKKQFRR